MECQFTGELALFLFLQIWERKILEGDMIERIQRR